MLKIHLRIMFLVAPLLWGRLLLALPQLKIYPASLLLWNLRSCAPPLYLSLWRNRWLLSQKERGRGHERLKQDR